MIPRRKIKSFVLVFGAIVLVSALAALIIAREYFIVQWHARQLGASDQHVQWQAIENLRVLGSKFAIPHLADTMVNDCKLDRGAGNSYLWWWCASTLLELGPEGARVLFERALLDPDGVVWTLLETQLSKTSLDADATRASVAVLGVTLRTGAKPSVRLRAIDIATVICQGQEGTRDIVPALLEAQKDADEEIRTAAESLLSTLRHQ